MFDGPETNTRLSAGWWEEKWDIAQTGWRREENNAGTTLFADNLALVERTLNTKLTGTDRKALVPLCGDSSVVTFLAQKGYEVVAIDFAETAVKKLRAKIAAEPEAVQKRITVVEGDLFDFDLPEGEAKFDFIYDKSAFVQIDPARRLAYAEKLRSLTTDTATCYLQGVMRSPLFKSKRGAQPPSKTDYAPWLKIPNIEVGPPHHLPASEVANFFVEGKKGGGGAEGGEEAIVGWKVHIDRPSMEALLEKLSDDTQSHGHFKAVLSRA